MWREEWVECLRPLPALLDPTGQIFSLRRYLESDVVVTFRFTLNWCFTSIGIVPADRMWNRSWSVQTVQRREWC